MNLEELKEKAIEEINNSSTFQELEKTRVKYLGRKGELTKILRSLKNLSLEEKRRFGPVANALKRELFMLVERKKEDLETKKAEEKFDLTKPGKRIKRGHLHPLTIISREVREVFTSLNFSIVEGPEVEEEYYNFDALNIPPDHPARDMWDTFWLRGNRKIPNSKLQTRNKSQISKSRDQKLLLRTHTSPVQVRYMEKNNPPFQIIVPGRVFRYEAIDASHEINFYQVEGLMVGKDVSLANLKYVVEEFLKKLLGEDIKFRFRPSYFPFVEPGLEVDIKFKNKGEWLEIMGAGMVHRKVFDYVRYNPNDVQGFAFGVGLDRLAMVKYDIPDIRLFYSSDLRFIHQF